jgi:hypothetical protein
VLGGVTIVSLLLKLMVERLLEHDRNVQGMIPEE